MSIWFYTKLGNSYSDKNNCHTIAIASDCHGVVARPVSHPPPSRFPQQCQQFQVRQVSAEGILTSAEQWVVGVSNITQCSTKHRNSFRSKYHLRCLYCDFAANN